MANKIILIVDDDPYVRQATQLALKANGFDTVSTGTAIATLSEARLHRPDLIMLDLGLPGGDGFLAMEMLRADPDLALIPIIVVLRPRHSRQSGARHRGRREGISAKPVDNIELLAVIRRALAVDFPPKATNTAA